MSGWMIPPEAVSEVFSISYNIGIWQDGWELSIRSGCCIASVIGAPSGTDYYSICAMCNAQFDMIENHTYGYKLNFGRNSWTNIDKAITDWIKYWIGSPGQIEVRYSGKTWQDATYVENWETLT